MGIMIVHGWASTSPTLFLLWVLISGILVPWLLQSLAAFHLQSRGVGWGAEYHFYTVLAPDPPVCMTRPHSG